MKRSYAIVIVNGNGPPSCTETKLQHIENKLYLMDVKMAVLVNAASQEIRQCVRKLTTMKREEVLDIIVVIQATRISENEFATKDGKIDIHHDILKPLSEKFVNKNKVIIMSGVGSAIDVAADSVESDGCRPFPRFYGKKFVIVTSKTENFIETFISKLVSERGNFEEAVKACPGTTRTGTVSELILSMGPEDVR